MTRFRGTGRGDGRGVLTAAALIGTFTVLALLVVGCGDGRTTTGTASPPAATLPPASRASASPDASGGTAPRPTPWPGNAVLGIEALGAADGQILAALSDIGRGIQTEDLALIRRAADGLTGLDVLLPNLDRINIYEPMVPFAERYGAAIRGIVAAATDVRSAIDARDANAIESSTGALIESFRAYTDVQPELATWVEQSFAQRRLIVR
jgi:hypothetical protein